MSAAADETRFLYLWRKAFLSRHGPPSTARLLLSGLAQYMDLHGESCFPSVETLKEVTGLSKQAVLTHIARAEADGWLKVSERGRGAGPGRQGWKRNEYSAQIPMSVLEAITREEEEAAGQGSLFQRERGQPGGPRWGEGGQRSRPRLTQRGQPHSETRSTSHADAVNDVDPISSVIGSGINPVEEAATAPAPAAAGGAEAEEQTAIAAMWGALDAGPVRSLFVDEPRWAAWRHAQRTLVLGVNPRQWHSDKLRGPAPWTDRPSLFGECVELYLEAVATGAPPPRLADLLRAKVIPRRYDPFRQRASGAPAPGTEHARAAGRGESPGAGRAHHPRRSTGLAPVDAGALPIYSGATEGEALAWAAANAGPAAEALAAARRKLELPDSVEIGAPGRGMLLRGEYLRRLGELRAGGLQGAAS